MAGITYKEWLSETSVVGKPRSILLREVDAQFECYEKFGGGDSMWRLQKALNAWKASKGPGDAWKKDRRNRGKAVDALTAQLNGTDTDKDVAEVPEFMQKDLAWARLGVIYLFSNLKVDSNLFNVILEGALSATGSILDFVGTPVNQGGMGRDIANIVNTNVSTVMVPGKELLQAIESSGHDLKTPQSQTLFKQVKEWLTNFARKILEELKERFGKVDVTIASIKNLINVLAEAFASTAAPFVSAGMDIAKGVVNILDSAVDRYKVWSHGQGVVLLSGHPSVIIDSIKRAMSLGIFEGLYQSLKGAGNVGLTFLTAGASMLVNVVVAMAEMLVKLIWRMVEISRMDRFFQEASEAWKVKDQSDSMHKQPLRFGAWYRDFALKLPALSVLTLNSGICGDKMLYLKMFKSDNQIISQNEFQHGCVYLDELKVWGSNYLDKCGYNFSTDDPVVTGYLKLAKSHVGNDDLGSRAWKFMVKAVNA